MPEIFTAEFTDKGARASGVPYAVIQKTMTMKSTNHRPPLLIFFLVCSVTLLFLAAGTRGQSSAFTFQGRLNDSGAPASGNYDIQLQLFDTGTAGTGTQIGTTVNLSAVPVTSGVFTVQPDFTAAAFPGADRFVEVGVKPAGSANPFTILSPRQPITPTPYALFSANAAMATYASNATNFNIAGTSTIGGSLTAGTSIGIGTTTPLAPLDVRGNMFIGLTNSAPAPLGQNALFIANDAGEANNSFRIDGYSDTLSIIGHSSAGAAHGANITFRTAPAGGGELDQMVINGAGNVGIGTLSPLAKLEVNGTVKIDGLVTAIAGITTLGDVKLGSTGQYFAPGGEEDLRIIRGTIGVDGTTHLFVISHGSGFTISSSNNGVIYITFTTPFSNIPAVTVTPDRNGQPDTYVANLDANCGCDRTKQVKIVLADVFQPTMGVQIPFDFIAIGPR